MTSALPLSPTSVLPPSLSFLFLPLLPSLLLSLPPSLPSVFKNYFILGIWVFCLLNVCATLAWHWISWNWSCKRLCAAGNQTIVPGKSSQCHLSNLTFVFFWDKFSPCIQHRPASNSISSCLCRTSAGIIGVHHHFWLCTHTSLYRPQESGRQLWCSGPSGPSVSL